MSMDTSVEQRRAKVVRAYYFFQFFFTLLFWTPIFFEFQKRLGLEEGEIFRIQSIYYVFFCLFEIPTGYFADRFGYRRSMKFGAVLLVVSNLIAVAAESFSGYVFAAMVLHWVLIAAARSFVSGASTAYLYEYLRRSGLSTQEFKRVEGNARAYSLLGRVLCFAVIGFLMEWKLSLPYWLTAASAAVSVGIVAWLPEFTSHPTAEEAKRLRPSLGSAFLQAMRSRWLVLLMFQGVVLFVLARVISVNLFQPILQSKSFGIGAYGVIMGAMTLVEAIGAARPHWMRRWFPKAYAQPDGGLRGDLDSVGVLSGMMAASIVFIPFVGQWGTLAVLGFFSLVTGLSYPIQRQVMNDAIPDPDFRATILSLESLVDRAVTAGVAASLEFLSRQMDLFLVFSGLGSLALVVGVQLMIHFELRRRALGDGKKKSEPFV